MGDQQETEAHESPPVQAKPRRRWLRRTAWIAVALVLLSGVWLAVTGFLAYRESQKLTDNLRAAETAASITITTPPFLTVDGAASSSWD